MEVEEKFKIIMERSSQIALASIKTNGKETDVRLMCYYYDFDTKKIYFCTFENSSKIEQFSKNQHVAFTTCTLDGDLAARVNHGSVQISQIDKTIILDKLSKKLELFNQIKNGDTSNIIAYEISFKRVHLHIGHNEVVTYINK